MAGEGRPPADSIEWRGIWFGVCVAIILGSALWLTGALMAIGAAIIGAFAGITAAVLFQRYLARISER